MFTPSSPPTPVTPLVPIASPALAAAIADLLIVPSKRNPFDNAHKVWLKTFYASFLVARDNRSTHRYARDIADKMQTPFPIIITAEALALASGDEKQAIALLAKRRSDVR
jgi:hypothetical protein